MEMSERATSLQTYDRPSAGQTSLRIVEPQVLYDRMNQLYDAIAQRAFQIFEDGGGLGGHDQENWFRAESELLHPAHVSISESEDMVLVDAEVPGFNPEELKVSLEPRRLTISGKRESSKEQKEKKAKTVYHEQCSSEILRVLDLPSDVDASKTTATLRNGVLELRMPKTAQARSTQVQVKAASGGA
jgi:HSP20 family protein